MPHNKKRPTRAFHIRPPSNLPHHHRSVPDSMRHPTAPAVEPHYRPSTVELHHHKQSPRGRRTMDQAHHRLSSIVYRQNPDHTCDSPHYDRPSTRRASARSSAPKAPSSQSAAI